MANRVKEIRNLLGLTRKEFGEELNLTQMCIGNYENQVRDPSVEIAYRIVDLAFKHNHLITLENIFPRNPC